MLFHSCRNNWVHPWIAPPERCAGALNPKEWEKSYDEPIGGIVTVNSELGEPIHKIATRGTLFWKELDTKVFSLPKEKRLAKLLTMKPYIIKRLNADYPKPWFPCHFHEENSNMVKTITDDYCEVWDMTYREIALRLVDILYHPHLNRWLCPTMRNLTGDWLDRIEERYRLSFPSLSLSLLLSLCSVSCALF